MKKVIGYIREYARTLNLPAFVLVSMLMTILIFLNYHNGLEDVMSRSDSLPLPYFTGHFLLFLASFLVPYVVIFVFSKRKFPLLKPFWILLFLAPALFALKMAMPANFFSQLPNGWNEYWNRIIQWPARLLVMAVLLLIIWRIYHRDQVFYGLTTRAWDIRPYLLMLLIMLPLLVAASTQTDFLVTYPKLQHITPLPSGANPVWFYKLLFELSYGSDFFTIELFFRGFLILGFIKWVGHDAILPMACFYCSIHFGKPLGECISSYFGGLFLGIVVYNTRSIYGGLLVHLGIAWLMEIAGYGGHHWW